MNLFIRVCLIFLCCLSVCNSIGQQLSPALLNDSNSFGDQIGLNINHPDAVEFQDLKKSTGTILFQTPPQIGYRRGTFFLVNSTNNSFSETNSKEIYLVTSTNNQIPIGSNDPNGLHDAADPQIMISFDYEVADPLKINYDDLSQNERSNVVRCWIIDLEELVYDVQNEIALYKVKPRLGDNWTIEDSEIFQHAYVAPWSLPMVFNETNDSIYSIKHVWRHWKKFFYRSFDQGSVNINNQRISISGLYSNPDNFATPLQISMDRTHVGSPIFNSDKRVSAVTKNSIDHRTIGRFLANSWYSVLHQHEEQTTLQSILDPDSTYLSYVEGGYLNDLIRNENSFDYDLEIDQNVNGYNAPFYKLFGAGSSIFGLAQPNDQLGHGILLSEDGHQGNEIILTASLNLGSLTNVNDYRLLYASGYDDAMHGIQTIFKGKTRPNSTLLAWIDLYPDELNLVSTFLDPTTALRANIVNIYSEYQNNLDTWTGLASVIDTQFSQRDVRISLRTETGQEKVRAIKIPHVIPFNTVELFDADRLADVQHSYKYPESRGMNSTSLHIDRKTIELKAYVWDSNANGCIELEWRYISDIKSGDNGGYLNLVNPNYQVNEVYPSDCRCAEKNKLRIKLHTNTNRDKHFGAWVDYDKQTDGYNYTFDNAVSPLTQEPEPSSNEILVILYELPCEEELSYPDRGAMKSRLRVGVATQPMSADGSGIYNEGEIEDYLLNIWWNSDQIGSYLIASSAQIRMTSASTPPGDNCLEHGTSPDTNNDELTTSHEGIDQTLPVHKLPLYGSASNVCPVELLDMENSFVGAHALKFNGDMFIDVAQGSDLVHKAAAEKTISIDFLVEGTNTTTNEVLYEEGGGANGLSIRRKDNHIDFGVKIAGELKMITSETALTANEMTNVTVMFDEGAMRLYMDGNEEAEDLTWGFDGNDIEEIPEHLDDAGLGGTEGEGIWADIDKGIPKPDNFTGVVDEFLYWDYGLTSAMIAIVASRTSKNTSSRIAAQSREDNESEVSEATFSMFPNPTSDQVNVLLEVQKAGPLNLMILDLSGKKVYHMSRPNIDQGHQLITIELLDLPSGEYIVKLQAGNVMRSEKLLIR
jgi:hypothetical protein